MLAAARYRRLDRPAQHVELGLTVLDEAQALANDFASRAVTAAPDDVVDEFFPAGPHGYVHVRSPFGLI